MIMFNERLKELRAEKKITQEALAKDINVSKGAVAMWETGKREPDMDMLKTIAAYFGTTVDDLIGAKSEKPHESERLPEELVILNRNAKKMSPENRKKLLEMARIMFKEDFDE